MNNQSACTATKIAHNLLLTAAHCFDESAEIVGFSTKQSNQELEFKQMILEEVAIHPSYAALDNNDYMESLLVQDIAIVKVSISSEFQNIPVRELDFSEISPDEELSFYGYGCIKSVNELEDYYPIRKVAVTDSLAINCLTSDHGLMTSFYQDISSVIYRNNVITPGKAKDSEAASICYGDSGGPLLRDGKVVGINTLYTFNDITVDGDSLSGISYLNLHARLSMAKDWIKKRMN